MTLNSLRRLRPVRRRREKRKGRRGRGREGGKLNSLSVDSKPSCVLTHFSRTPHIGLFNIDSGCLGWGALNPDPGPLGVHWQVPTEILLVAAFQPVALGVTVSLTFSFHQLTSY
jgi:hypothetical protein